MPDHDDHQHEHEHGRDPDPSTDPSALLEEPSPFDPEATRATTTAPPEPVDPAQQSLADALQFSFLALKFIMAALLVGYLFTGVFSVDEQEVAVRLRFGEIVGESRDEMIYRQGWHFGWPIPIEDSVKIKTDSRTVTIDDAFWYELDERQASLSRTERAQQLRQPLNPERDGSLVTGDANIVHGQFTAAYRVPGDDPDAVIHFVHNVGDMDRAAELVRAAVEQGAVYAAAQSTADAFINNAERVRILARQRAQQILDQMNTGLRIDTLSATTDMPNAVIQAFNAVSEAESQRGQLIDQARQQATQTLGATAGAAAEPLFELVRAYELARSAQDDFLAPRLDRVLSFSLDQLLVPNRVSELVSLTDRYRGALAAEDQAADERDTAAGLRDEIDDLVQAITTDDPRRVLSRTLESYAVAVQAGRAEEADRLSQRIDRRLEAVEGGAALGGVMAAYEQLQQAEAGQPQAEAAVALISESQALAEAVASEGEAVGGAVAQAIYQAQSYRTGFVNRVQSEAERFNRLLAEYRRNPRIVKSRLWQDTREAIFTSPDVETFYAMPGDIRLDMNRDPEVQRQREERALQAEQEQPGG